MLPKSQSFSCLSSTEFTTWHRRSPSQDSTNTLKASNLDVHGFAAFFEKFSCIAKRDDEETVELPLQCGSSIESYQAIKKKMVRANKELSQQCQELSSRIQVLIEEVSVLEHEHRTTLQSLRSRRTIMINDMQKLFCDCSSLEKKITEIRLKNQPIID